VHRSELAAHVIPHTFVPGNGSDAGKQCFPASRFLATSHSNHLGAKGRADHYSSQDQIWTVSTWIRNTISRSVPNRICTLPNHTITSSYLALKAIPTASQRSAPRIVLRTDCVEAPAYGAQVDTLHTFVNTHDGACSAAPRNSLRPLSDNAQEHHLGPRCLFPRTRRSIHSRCYSIHTQSRRHLHLDPAP